MNLESIYASDFANPSIEMDKDTLLSEGQKLVDTLVVHWTKNADELQTAEKRALIALVDKSAKAIIYKIGVLLNARCSQEVIRKNVLRSLADMQLSAEVFYESKHQYIVRQQCVKKEGAEISEGIGAIKTQPAKGIETCNEKPLFKEFIEKSSIEIDEAHEKEYRNDEIKFVKMMLILNARWISMGVDIAALPVTLPLAGVVGALDHTQKTVCQIHPNIEATCKQISSLADEAIEDALKMIPEMFMEAYHTMGDGFEKFVKSQVACNEKYGIPEETTRQFIADVTKILIVGTSGGTAVVGVKNGITAITPLKKTVTPSVSKKMVEPSVYHPALSTSDTIKKDLNILAKGNKEAKTFTSSPADAASAGSKNEINVSLKGKKETEALAYNPADTASAGSKNEMNVSLKSDKDIDAPMLTKQEKNAIAWDQHNKNIAREQNFLNALKMESPSNLPQGFPANTKEFKLSSKVHSYDRKNLGIDKEGRVRNHFRYQSLEESKSAVFWVTRSKDTFDKVVNGEVIKRPMASKGMSALDITKEALKEVVDLSREQELERIFLIWNSKHYPVISNLPTTDKISIVSVGKFKHNTNIYDTKPLDLVEILIKK